ncbi:septum formation family protein [Nocardiopsis sp. NRRL B-16309]|uniref:septum formation family protein n=1 Tax=Nocardiopsis sp. NRRL B-16309 TaxID=1519494 RepID=UPI0006AE4825|nr:septum formation family protein [Nocardiopsis sp. NRRL B-16309]KOX24237.1 septum formation family protein [Nocardiopsis sp. NRRL B-16309]
MPSCSPALRTAALSTLAVGAAVVLSGCGVVTQILGGADNNVFELNVGDCFIESEMSAVLGGGEVSEVPLVDCAEPHDAEFFFSHEMPDGDYPGDAAVTAEGSQVCEGQAFTDFVGVPYEESLLHSYALTPTEESWNTLDDREVICYVYHPDEMVTETLGGAAY